MSRIYDALIIGGGPAGLSTALALGRIHRTCTVFSDSVFRNHGIEAAHSIITRDHTHPQVIRDLARKDIEKYRNATFVETRITKISKVEDKFVAENEAGNSWTGRTVVLAMGVVDLFPDLKGYKENWPLNMYVSLGELHLRQNPVPGTYLIVADKLNRYQCLFCDGHEHSHLPMGILCYPKFTPMYAHMAGMMLGLSRPAGADPTTPASPITFFTNGTADTSDTETVAVLEKMEATGIMIEHRPVVELIPHKEGQEKGLDVVVQNLDHSNTSGSPNHKPSLDRISLGFIAHKPPTSVAAPYLIEQLGVETEQGMFGPYIKVSPPTYSTSVPGVFAAGDAGVVMTHISHAMLTGNAVAAGVGGYTGSRIMEQAVAAKKAGS
jgi:thioredoxin reductase